MRQWTVDAFAAAPFKGNPACVVEPCAAWPDAAWMQSLAAENNQAETAFLLKTDQPDRFGLRWFTPAVEVPLCGHATLASAHALFNELGVDAPSIAFETLKSGVLTVRRLGERIEMDFPADPPRRIPPPPGLAEALGVEPVEVWLGQYLVAVVETEAEVRGLTPHLGQLEGVAAEGGAARGNVSVAALADAGQDYQVVSRFFAPGSGIPEDPTTGSAHCILAPLYADKLGEATLQFHQAYPGRGGDIEAEVVGDRVLLRGVAVTVMEGVLRL